MLAAAGAGFFPADALRPACAESAGAPASGTAAAPPRGPASPRRFLRLAIAASLAAHGLLLAAGGGLYGHAGLAAGSQTADRLGKTWLNARLAPPALPVPAATRAPVPSLAMTPAPGPSAEAAQPLARAEPAPSVPLQAPLPAAEPEPAAPATVQSEQGLALLPAELPAQENIVYFKPSELDERAVPIASIDPQPDRAPPGIVTIRLRLYISATGFVDKVDVLAVAPESFPTDFAVSAFRQGRFDPAKIAAVPVASQKTVELTFAPG